MIKDKYSRVVYFDTETTGFDPEKHQIIEFAAVVCDGNESRDEDFFVRLRREDSIPEKITQITGITDLDLVHGKEEEDLIQCFKDLCSADGHVLLVAHNAQFDLGFIAQTMIRYISPRSTLSTLQIISIRLRFTRTGRPPRIG